MAWTRRGMTRNPLELGFLEHLDELGRRLVKCVAAVGLGSGLFYIFTDGVLAFVVRPVGQLIFTAPQDAFLARLFLAFLGGIFLALPVILYQIWSFVGSALTAKERKYIFIFAPFSLILFLLGGIFAYGVAIPMTMRFLLGFATEWMMPMITVKNYISFVGTMIFAFGVTFEMPLVLMFLTKIGVATPEFLAQKRKHAVVLILIVSAVLTPPDFVTQLIMAGPLIVLYEIGIGVSKFVGRRGPI